LRYAHPLLRTNERCCTEQLARGSRMCLSVRRAEQSSNASRVPGSDKANSEPNPSDPGVYRPAPAHDSRFAVNLVLSLLSSLLEEFRRPVPAG